MNILFLCHRMPYPPNKGDKIRSFNEIKHLGARHKLHLAFLVDDERDLAQLESLRGYCSGIDYQLISPKWQRLKVLPYLATALPLSVPYFYSARLQAAVDRVLDCGEIDLVFCFSSPMAQYVFKSRHYGGGRLAGARLAMDFVDVDSDKWRMYSASQGFPRSRVYRREWLRLQEYESMIGERFDWSFFVSDKELELFRSFCPGASASTVANGVDREYFGCCPPPAAGEEPGPVILFTGAMDYFPNEDAVLHFAKDLLPLIRRKLPDARFYVVGSNPGERVLALGRDDPGITVTGYVPDVRPYLSLARVFVAPFRIARGVQNKVLEAMAAGVPVVARPEAVQGLLAPGGCLRVAEGNDAFARAVLESLADPGRQDAIEAARLYVERHYDWERNLAGLDRLFGSR